MNLVCRLEDRTQIDCYHIDVYSNTGDSGYTALVTVWEEAYGTGNRLGAVSHSEWEIREDSADKIMKSITGRVKLNDADREELRRALYL